MIVRYKEFYKVKFHCACYIDKTKVQVKKFFKVALVINNDLPVFINNNNNKNSSQKEAGGGSSTIEGKEISQRTYMHNPQTDNHVVMATGKWVQELVRVGQKGRRNGHI